MDGWGNSMSSGTANGSVSTVAMLNAELTEIAKRRGGLTQFDGADSSAGEQATLASTFQRAAGLNLTALCLSGSGIRSAAFCLGVLQTLAQRQMLGQFDYLSTVSGGGFIGGWLQVLIKESGD